MNSSSSTTRVRLHGDSTAPSSLLTTALFGHQIPGFVRQRLRCGQHHRGRSSQSLVSNNQLFGVVTALVVAPPRKPPSPSDSRLSSSTVTHPPLLLLHGPLFLLPLWATLLSWDEITGCALTPEFSTRSQLEGLEIVSWAKPSFQPRFTLEIVRMPSTPVPPVLLLSQLCGQGYSLFQEPALVEINLVRYSSFPALVGDHFVSSPRATAVIARCVCFRRPSAHTSRKACRVAA